VEWANANDSLPDPMVMMKTSISILMLPALECNRRKGMQPAGRLLFSDKCRPSCDGLPLDIYAVEIKNRTKVARSATIIESPITTMGNTGYL